MDFKGLDKHGNCYYKFDFVDRQSGNKIKLRVPADVGFEMILLFSEQLKKLFKNGRKLDLFNSNEKLEFSKLKDALINDKTLDVKYNLKGSIKYNSDYFAKYANRINEIELKQEEALAKSIANQKALDFKEYKEQLDKTKINFIEGDIDADKD